MTVPKKEKEDADFRGFATVANQRCTDGRIIAPFAFKHQDGDRVPLLYRHDHDDINNVLGQVLMEHRDKGVYVYGFFNESENAQAAKLRVAHGDITRMSIFAGGLIQEGSSVKHGSIKEVSLVLAGANPGATIESVNIMHEDGTSTEIDDAIIIHADLFDEGGGESETEDEEDVLEDEDASEDEDEDALDDEDALEHEDKEGPTPAEVYESMTPNQKMLLHFMIEEVEKTVKHDDQEGSDMSNRIMKNVFEKTEDTNEKSSVLSHDEFANILKFAQDKKTTLKEAILAHEDEYGITNIDMLFPEARDVNGAIPEWVKRDTGWVAPFMAAIRKSPFSRIRSRSADLTHEEARAKGYIKGTLKKEQFFAIAKRVTTPTTVYKKQKLDRDDILDVTDFDVVAWIRTELRFQLEEEIARAVLVGDGRDVEDPDKINETNIRPVARDDDFYAHKITLPSNVNTRDFVRSVVKSRRHYKGSGPTFYTTEEVLSDLLLATDLQDRDLYPTIDALKNKLRVSNIVTVEVLEEEAYDDIIGIIFNPSDYTLGADRGGQIASFDDFDIDFNQHKYLMETRVSGALTKHKTALVFLRSPGTAVVPLPPTQGEDELDRIITIPSVTGIDYTIAGNVVTGSYEIEGPQGTTVVVKAFAQDGYYILDGVNDSWNFTATSEEV